MKSLGSDQEPHSRRKSQEAQDNWGETKEEGSREHKAAGGVEAARG